MEQFGQDTFFCPSENDRTIHHGDDFVGDIQNPLLVRNNDD